ncbi:DNA helicase [Caulobacter phage KSC]|uniref:DNA helicase n=1 Tax=Caulobacter phage KSC TaxID=3020398 RepID=A0AAE9X6Q9_9CAUD|nr:DNA helicase [Caulobacter phage KSC]
MLRRREDHDKVIRAVPKHVMDIHTKTILEDFGKFFAEFPDEHEIDGKGTFWTWFYSFAHPSLNAEQRAHYQALLAQVNEELTQAQKDGLMARLVEADAAHRMTEMLQAYNEGGEVSVAAELRAIMDKLEQDTARKVKTPLVQADIRAMLEQDRNNIGFTWPPGLEGLNLCMRPGRAGDFIVGAARPDTGKTSLAAAAVVHWATQLDEVFPPIDGIPQEREIIWLNNEGMGDRIVMRLYQAALAATVEDLCKWDADGTLYSRYVEAIGGRDCIKVYDVHEFWTHELEDILRTTKPGIIIGDMPDNFRYGGDVNNGGQRTDQLLEALYQWLRIRGVKYNSMVYATSQISADGENMAYPLLGMLKDSKTGKQGAADVILTMGFKPEFPTTRYLGCTKNKLVRSGKPKDPRIEVTFDGSRCTFKEQGISMGATDERAGSDPLNP